MFASLDVRPEIRNLKMTNPPTVMCQNRPISCFKSPIIHPPRRGAEKLNSTPPGKGWGFTFIIIMECRVLIVNPGVGKIGLLSYRRNDVRIWVGWAKPLDESRPPRRFARVGRPSAHAARVSLWYASTHYRKNMRFLLKKL